MTWQIAAAACDLARAIHAARGKAEEAPTTWESLGKHDRRLLHEIAQDILLDLLEAPDLAQVANEHVSQARRVPLQWRAKR